MSSVAEIFNTMEYGPAPESDKEVLSWLGKHERVFGHYIGGAWTEPGHLFEVIGGGYARRLRDSVDRGDTRWRCRCRRRSMWWTGSIAFAE